MGKALAAGGVGLVAAIVVAILWDGGGREVSTLRLELTEAASSGRGSARLERTFPVESADALEEASPGPPTERTKVAAPTPRAESEPATGGAFSIRVFELDGTRIGEGLLCGIGPVTKEEQIDPTLAVGRELRTKELVGGEVRFDDVEPGRKWEVAAFTEGSDVRTSREVLGPTRPGEVVEVRLVRGRDHPLVGYRVLDEGGTPLRRAVVEVTRFQIFRERVVRRRTDEDGVFTIAVAPLGRLDGSEMVVRHLGEGGQELYGRAAIPKALAKGLQAGGDVHLRPASLLAAGIVLDADGAPVARAKVVAGANTLDGRAWNPRGSVEGRSDELGRFELRGFLLASSFEVRAGRGEERSQVEEVEAGRTGLVLTLASPGVVSGRVLVPEGFHPGKLAFRLREDGEEKPVPYQGRVMQMGGDYSLHGVPQGVYDLELAFAGTVLHRAPRLVVTSGASIDPIDLRSRLATVHVLLQGGDGEPMGTMRWTASGTEHGDETTFEEREVVLSTLAGPVDLLVSPEGYREVSLGEVVGRAVVELTPPLFVRLDLDTTGPLPAPPYFLDPVLELDGRRVGRPVGTKYFTEENRSVLFEVGSAGRLEVTWHLELEGKGWGAGGSVLSGERVPIEVLDAGGTQLFTVRLDESALEQLVSSPPF